MQVNAYLALGVARRYLRYSPDIAIRFTELRSRRTPAKILRGSGKIDCPRRKGKRDAFLLEAHVQRLDKFVFKQILVNELSGS